MSDALLPPSVGQAFAVAAGELGMCGASWLFVRELAASSGEEAVPALRERLGRDFPVLDAVAALWLEGRRGPEVDPERVVRACAGASRLVVVGFEADFLDALVPRLPGVRIALLAHAPFDVDWERVASNYGGAVETTDLATFQSFAGRRSVLLTFAYGIQGERAHVRPAWLRVAGDDVRTQFRGLVAWDVLRAPMYVYPRWLVEVAKSTFSHLA